MSKGERKTFSFLIKLITKYKVIVKKVRKYSFKMNIKKSRKNLFKVQVKYQK